jgi:hypothetical protein
MFQQHLNPENNSIKIRALKKLINLAAYKIVLFFPTTKKHLSHLNLRRKIKTFKVAKNSKGCLESNLLNVAIFQRIFLGCKVHNFLRYFESFKQIFVHFFKRTFVRISRLIYPGMEGCLRL